MIVQSDQYNSLYPDMNYNFYVIIPQYFTIPICLLLGSILKSVDLKLKILGLLTVELLSFIVVYFITLEAG